MKISVLSPPEIALPVKGYGGIEKIAYDLYRELARKHDARIYGSGSAAIPYPYDYDFDLMIDFTHEKRVPKNASKQNYISVPFLTDNLSHVNDVFPSRAVRDGFNADGRIIYPGIDPSPYRYSRQHDDYLLFLGRISVIKRPHVAIQVARMLGMKCIIAGHTGKYASFPDSGYVNMIRHLCNISDGLCSIVEEPGEEEKVSLLSNAKCVIIPSDWSIIGSMESFGIVAVEALLSGKPCIVSHDGGLKEIVTEETGFVCSTLDEYVNAIKKIDSIDSSKCRERGLYFTSERYAEELLSSLHGSNAGRGNGTCSLGSQAKSYACEHCSSLPGGVPLS
jgi:glycosyltransferase involved in cell wall biosynthesis